MKKKSWNAMFVLIIVCMIWGGKSCRTRAAESITLLRKTTSYDADGNVLSWIDYSYDSFGNLLTEMHSIGYTYDYDSTGNLVKYSVSEDNIVTSWTNFSNDLQGNVSEGRCYRVNSDGNYEMYRKIIYSNTYDSTGRLLSVLGYCMDIDIDSDMSYSLFWEKHITYDENGNVLSLLTKNILDNDASSTVFEYIYDSSGTLLGDYWYWINEDGDVTDSSYSTYEYQYDSEGNILSRASYNEEGIYGGCLEYSYETILVESDQSSGSQSESDAFVENYADTDEDEISYTAAGVDFLTYHDSISTEDQVNTYTITPAVSGTYRIDFSGMMSGFEIRCNIYDSLNERVGGTHNFYTTGNGEGVTISLTAGETYRIDVEQHDDTGDYTMTIGQEKAAVTIDDYSVIYDMIEFEDQNIGYKLTPTVTGIYRFDFSEMVNGFEIKLNIYNSLNERVGGTNNFYTTGNGEGVTVSLTAGETYILNVVQNSGMGSYTMNVGKQNETRTLSANSIISDEITFDDQQNNYEFTVADSAAYQFSLGEMYDGFSVRVYIYDYLGYEVVSKRLQNSSLTVELTGGDTYKIVVSQYDGTGCYTLSVN